MNQLVNFNNIAVSIIDHNGKKWLTSEQVGLCLGYSVHNARQGINKLYDRHTDEFTESDSTEVKLTSVDGKQREMRVFSDTGCTKLAFFSATPRSKEFRHWASKVLTGQMPVPAVPVTVEDRLGNLEAALHQLVTHTAQQTQAMTVQAENVGTLVDVALQQATKLDVVSRYIGLLEINQKGKIRVTRTAEAQVLALFAQGMRQSDIAYNLRLSTAAVSQLVHGKYPWSQSEASSPRVELGEEIELKIEAEREKLYAAAEDRKARQRINQELLKQINQNKDQFTQH